MSEDTSKALLDELRQFKADVEAKALLRELRQFRADVEARRKRRRTVLWVIASPLIAFAAVVVVFAISEATSSTQYHATSIGMSISECENVMRTLGGPRTPVGKCIERVPKKP
jgi:type VI protein secretion system component VasF